MPGTRIPLTGGSYSARSSIAQAIRQVNLYAEANPGGTASYTDVPSSPRVPETLYPTPGTRQISVPAAPGPGRGLFTTSTGDLYCVNGSNVSYIKPDWTQTVIGSIPSSTGPVSFTENGLTVVLVDGSSMGWQIDIPTRVMTQITDANFFGAGRVDVIDTYIVGNLPTTRTFFSSTLNSVTFDPLYVANKSGYPDLLVSIIVLDRSIWLLGAATTEIWYNAGGADFPFQLALGLFIQYGCAAAASVARQGEVIFWLGQDLFGARMVIMGKSQQGTRISTHALEYAMASYTMVSDAVGWCYQQEGHQFYMLNFPSADHTWCFDLATGLWHERVWLDANNLEHKHRAATGTYAYNTVVVTDWETGYLSALELDNYSDNGSQIQRRRGFAQLIDADERQFYDQFILDMAVGESVGTLPGPL